MWRSKFRQIIFSVAIALAFFGAWDFRALAGAWTPDQGHGEIIVATIFEQAAKAYDQTGRLVPTPLYRSAQANIYVAYGVTDWLAAIVRPGLQSSSVAAPANQRYTGLGDSEIAAQARVWRDETTVISVLAGARAPTSGGATNSWLQGPNRAEYDIRVLLGHNIGLLDRPGFVDFSAGFRLVGGSAPNEGHFDATLGLYVTPELLVLAQSFNTISGASNNPNTPQWAQYKAQLSLVYRFAPEWRAQAGFYVTLAGTNAYRENGALLGVWRNF
jgi:hypothetical protein